MGIVLARLLTPEEFGDFAYVSATVGIIMLPLSITVNPLLITNVNNDNTLFGRVLGFTSIACALKLLVLSCYISFLILSERADEALLVFLIGAPIAIADLPETLKCDLEGRGRFAPNVVAQLANLSVHAAVSILLVLLGYGVYGLAAGVWGADLEHAKAVGRRLQAGQVEVNGGSFNIQAPFGGYKQSGVGREAGVFGLEEFCEIKSMQF